jgi:hypothetical protein
MPVGMTESNKPVGTWGETCTGTKVSGQNPKYSKCHRAQPLSSTHMSVSDCVEDSSARRQLHWAV